MKTEKIKLLTPPCPSCGKPMRVVGHNHGHKVYRCQIAHAGSKPPKNVA